MSADLFLAVVPLDICPVAPANAQVQVDKIVGYVLWGVGCLFGVSVIVAIGAVIAGRLFSMPHASKVGVISLVVIVICVLAWLVVPGMVASMLGSGCIPSIGGGGTR